MAPSRRDMLYGSSIRKDNGYDSDSYTYYPVVVIGAGESGIAMGCRLREVLDFDQFRIFDRQSGIGGTWWINRYPGVACDVPAVFYSFSFSQNSEWSTFHPTGPEIVKYLQGVCNKYEIIDKIELNTDVQECRWNEEEQIWDVTILHLTAGSGDLTAKERQQKEQDHGRECVVLREERIRTKVLISAVGGLVEPKTWPDNIPGKDKFQGETFHSARWKYDVDLKGKDVIVVGTGCSAAQFVPRLTKEYGAKSVTQLMRSPPWVVPRQQPPMGPETWEKWAPWLNDHVPGFARSMRTLCALGSEYDWRLFGTSEYSQKERTKLETKLIAHMKSTVPLKYHEILTPDYGVGCKRRIFDATWFPGLNDPNIELTTLPLTSLSEDSVTLGPGRTYPPESNTASKAPSHEVTIPADVIILANGFEVVKWLHPLEVHGRDGKTLQTVFEERGGPQMYMGAAMDGFPNFFTIFGPNTATGHSSVILASENMVEMTIKLIAPVLKGDVVTTEVKRDAEEEWTRDVQKACKDTVWHKGGCASWYRTDDDWNSTVYPYSQLNFWFRCMFPTWSDWNITYTARGLAKKRMKSALRYLLCAVVLTGLYRGRQQGKALKDLPAVVRGYLRSALMITAGTLQVIGTKI